MSFLLDTNVVSELRKAQPDPAVSEWIGRTDSVELYLSVLVVGEIRQGVDRLRRRGDIAQADDLERWLGALRRDFSERLLPVSVAIAERWGALNAVSPLAVVDGLVVATALEHDLILVSRDEPGWETGVRLFNPWR